MKRDEFLKVVDKAIEEKQGIAVFISMPWLNKPEVILNPQENLEEKRTYYLDAYDENMRLKSNENIKITKVLKGDLGWMK